jgi:hypothetical protein
MLTFPMIYSWEMLDRPSRETLQRLCLQDLCFSSKSFCAALLVAGWRNISGLLRTWALAHPGRLPDLCWEVEETPLTNAGSQDACSSASFGCRR